jgi:sensor histidine kinase regulating citrate/malate metabolism
MAWMNRRAGIIRVGTLPLPASQLAVSCICRGRREGGGSGIGLTIARALIEAHGGRIWAESPGQGRGSVFVFTLPVAR